MQEGCVTNVVPAARVICPVASLATFQYVCVAIAESESCNKLIAVLTFRRMASVKFWKMDMRIWLLGWSLLRVLHGLRSCDYATR